MKIKVAAILIEVISIAMPAPALAEKVPVATNKDGTIYYVETNSIDHHAPDSSESGMTTSFIQLTEYPEARDNGVRELRMNKYVDCLTGKAYTTSTVALDDRGFSITSKGGDERPSAMVGATSGGAIREFVCNYYRH